MSRQRGETGHVSVDGFDAWYVTSRPERVDDTQLDSTGLPAPIATSPSGRRYYAMYDQATAEPGRFTDSLGRKASKLKLEWGVDDGAGQENPDVWE